MEAEVVERDRFYEFLAWAHARRTQLAVGIGLFLLALIVVAFVTWRKGEQEAAANQALFKIPFEAASRKNPEASSYLKVAQDYAGTKAAQRAQILAAGGLFAEAKYAEAQAAFQKLLLTNPTGELAAEASLGVAASIEAQGKTDEAITRYREVLSKHGTDAVADQARLSLARLYDAHGQGAEALKLYNVVIKPNPYDPWSSEAQQHKQMLLARFPDLEKTSLPSNSLPRLQTTGSVPRVSLQSSATNTSRK